MPFENAVSEANPEMLASHAIEGRDVIYFTVEDTPARLTTMAAAVFAEAESRHRPVSDMRAEAMRLYEHGLCTLVQRRTERRIGAATIVTVDYIAASRRRAA